ncbi:zinc finger protein 653-like isoform X2 [Rhineura floridana]|nr:zinc finger protein 653-like isoform X2 [Rhineura floridana]
METRELCLSFSLSCWQLKSSSFTKHTPILPSSQSRLVQTEQTEQGGRRRNVNCLKNTVIWYEDHKNRCPYEPHLSELDPTFGMYTTAVWQCEAGHRYFQDLHSPLKPLSDSESECDNE